MAEEQVTRGSAGPAQRPPQRRRGRAVPAADERGARPDLDERERNISPRRKAMGPVVPPEGSRGIAAEDVAAIPEVPPTDPE
jgi:hypothetical protein